MGITVNAAIVAAVTAWGGFAEPEGNIAVHWFDAETEAQAKAALCPDGCRLYAAAVPGAVFMQPALLGDLDLFDAVLHHEALHVLQMEQTPWLPRCLKERDAYLLTAERLNKLGRSLREFHTVDTVLRQTVCELPQRDGRSGPF